MGQKRGWFISAVYDEADQKMYYIGNNIDGFYSWDLVNNTVELLDSMDTLNFKNEMYNCGVIQNQYILFPPRNESKVFWFDKINKRSGFVDLYIDDIIKKIDFKLGMRGHIATTNEKGTAYFIYRDYPIVTIVEDISKEYRYLYLPDKCDEFYLSNYYTFDNGTYYCPFIKKNKVFVFDSINEKIEIININGIEHEGFSSVEYKDGALILLSVEGNCIVKYDLKSKESNVMILDIEKTENGDSRKIIIRDNRYLIIPNLDISFAGKMKFIYVLDEQFNVIETQDSFKEKEHKKKWSVFEDDNYQWYIFFEPTFNDFADQYWTQEFEMVKLNLHTLEIEYVNFPVTTGWTIEMISKRVETLQSEMYIRYDPTPVENPRIGLQQYLDVITTRM